MYVSIFSIAEIEFENVLAKDPQDRFAKKKLIICLIQNRMIKKAFDLFYEVIVGDITIHTETNVNSLK